MLSSSAYEGEAKVSAGSVLAASCGNLYAFGSNVSATLGVGDKENRFHPTIVPQLFGMGVKAVSAGDNCAAAITHRGGLYVWGTLSGTPRISPYLTWFLADKGLKDVACGKSMVFILTETGEIWKWGESCVQPKPIPCTAKFRSLSCGAMFNAGVSKEGLLFTWGDNAFGQLGQAGREIVEPRLVPSLASVVVNMVSCGRNHMAIIADGLCWAWGSNSKGQCGHGGRREVANPEVVCAEWKDNQPWYVSCGSYHTAVILQDASLWTTGEAKNGALGYDAIRNQTTFAPVPGIRNVACVACGLSHTIAITMDGLAYSWGNGDKGALGIGATTQQITCEPQQIPFPTGETSFFVAAGGTGFSFLISLHHEDSIKQALLSHKHMYECAQLEGLSIFAGTWNCDSNENPGLAVTRWLTSCEDIPDICAIGLQEIDMTPQALVAIETDRGEKWKEAIANRLASYAEPYVCLVARQMVGIFLGIFVQKRLADRICVVAHDIVGVGLGGNGGNKGAVAASLKIGETSLCVISAHLAAHQQHVTARNENYKQLLSYLFVSTKTLPVLEHDRVIWMGDLNYRIDQPRPTVLDVVAKHRQETLLPHDQLNKARQACEAFNGFNEQPITFAPTFKYDRGTNNYDSSKKQRIPAWCDRILWRDGAKGYLGIDPKGYRRHEQLESDHRPVSAMFRIVTCTRDDEKLQQITSKLEHYLSRPDILRVHSMNMNDATAAALQQSLAAVASPPPPPNRKPPPPSRPPPPSVPSPQQAAAVTTNNDNVSSIQAELQDLFMSAAAAAPPPPSYARPPPSRAPPPAGPPPSSSNNDKAPPSRPTPPPPSRPPPPSGPPPSSVDNSNSNNSTRPPPPSKPPPPSGPPPPSAMNNNRPPPPSKPPPPPAAPTTQEIEKSDSGSEFELSSDSDSDNEN